MRPLGGTSSGQSRSLPLWGRGGHGPFSVSLPRHGVGVCGTVATEYSVSGLRRPGRLPVGRRIHGGMDRGAAAREKNGANNLAKHDRNNHLLQPIPRLNPNHSLTKGPSCLRRRTYANKSAGRPLTPEALSGTGAKVMPQDVQKYAVGQPEDAGTMSRDAREQTFFAADRTALHLGGESA